MLLTCIIAAMTTNRALTRRTTAAAAPGTPRRVSLLIGQLGLGGTEKQVTLLALGLHAQGIRTSVLVLFDGGPHEATLRRAGVPVVHLGGPYRIGDRRRLRGVSGIKGLWEVVRWAPGFAASTVDYLGRVVKLISVLRRERPDVLHAFLLHSYLAAGPAARLARVPLCVAGRRSLSDCSGARRPVVLAVARAATLLTDMVVANAHEVAEDARRVEHIPKSKIATIYNGIGASAFEPAQPAALDIDGPVILCVANLIAYKGHRYLLQAAARLRERDIECTLVLAGDGPERGPLQKLAADLGVEALFLGRRGDIPALLARADVVALPSLTEGMSNAVMEAMAAGKPVVATDVGGNRELLRGRGVLVPPANADELADGLAEVLADPELARRIGAEAQRWSRRNLHVDTMIDEHLDLYTRLLESRCAG